MRPRSFAVLLLALGLGCVDLTPPPSLVQWRQGNGGGDGFGGSLGEGTGGVDAAGATGVGGRLGTGGASGPGSGGAALGTGGKTVPPEGTGGKTALPSGVGGASGLGGAQAGTGGAPGTGGTIGTGGRSGAGGVVGTGGVVGAGGVGTGGRVGTGGAPGTGGRVGTGGSPGSGGSTAGGYNKCATPITPANKTSGGVTDFTDWDAGTVRWGSSAGLNGTVFAYASTNASMTTPPKVEGTPPGLHLVGSVPASAYAGGGLTFLSCVKSTGFTRISFQAYGSAVNCNIELQLQTFDQRPTDQDPPGGCTGTCYTFPLFSQVVTPTAAPGVTVTKLLTDLTRWSDASSTQLVGIQWQFTSNGSGTCTPNVTFTNIKLVP